jgi:hypothetical protein
MIDCEVIPHESLSTTRTLSSFFRIPQKPPLLWREQTPFVLILEERTQKTAENLSSSLPVGSTISIALHG